PSFRSDKIPGGGFYENSWPAARHDPSDDHGHANFRAGESPSDEDLGVGSRRNPCSRTAPCKTFAGAISKTAAGGEINVLDPGGFGAVTITKSISILSQFEAGVLVSG